MLRALTKLAGMNTSRWMTKKVRNPKAKGRKPCGRGEDVVSRDGQAGEDKRWIVCDAHVTE